MAEQNAKYLNKCRLLRVFEYMQNTDEQHPLNITQIIAKLLEDGVCDREPDRKSIMRDLQTIEACGYKLEACENHNDGKYLNYENKPFGCDQLKMLADAVASARFLTAEDAKKLVNKIFQLGTPSDRKFLKEAVICDASLNVALSKTKYNFDKIMEAIRDKKQISFQYNYKFVPNPQQKDLSHEGMEYFVSPYYFVPMNDDYYVIGCTGEYKNFSHYRLSRMVNVRVQGKAANKLTDSTDYKMLKDSCKNICASILICVMVRRSELVCIASRNVALIFWQGLVIGLTCTTARMIRLIFLRALKCSLTRAFWAGWQVLAAM